MINLDGTAIAHEENVDLLTGFYRTIMRIRIVEECVADLVEDKEIRTPCHLYIGQEAIATGVSAALRVSDQIWGGHRSHGHYLAKGGDLRTMVAEIFSRETGCSGGRGGSMHLLDPDAGISGTVPLVGATISLAVGNGLSFKMKKLDGVSVSYFGDGATEEGHFHESLNLASLYRLPVLFVCENNFYSSHLPLKDRRVGESLIPFAEAHQIPAERLDGNDVVAVHRAACKAVERARKGDGPTFLECLTYRWRGHVGASWDMDVGVKRREELKEWVALDPAARVRTRLVQLGWDEKELDSIERDIRREVADAIADARKAPKPDPGSLMDHVYYQGSL